MTENPSQALVLADSAVAIRNAVQFWAEATTRAETFDRSAKLQDKIQAVSAFFAFSEKNPGDIMPEDVQKWRSYLESRGQKPATVYARISRVSSFYKWLMADAQLSLYIRRVVVKM